MGKANQARRAAKKRREHRRASERYASADGTGFRSTGRVGGGSSRPDLGFIFVRAATVVAGSGGDAGVLDDVMEPVLEACLAAGSRYAALVLDEVFGECLGGVWEGGWQPGEVARAVRRRATARHADLVATAIASEASLYPVAPPSRWSEQLTDLGATERWWGDGRDWLGAWALRSGLAWSDAIAVSVEALAVLLSLPVTEVLMPPPSKWALGDLGTPSKTGHVDESILAKVRALLAKAESTNFEHEADALTAKAQQLMARHAIDEALARRGSDVRESPVARRVAVDDPYANAKSSLFGVVALANGVRAIWDDVYAHMTLVGFESDIDGVELLFTSLLMQGSNAMLAKGRVVDWRGRSRTRSFRQSFYVAFAQRIHERLVMATNQARLDAERDLGMDLLPVLAGRREDVDDVTARMFPRLTKAKSSAVTNREGWIAGRAAAEMATLGPIRPSLDGTTG